MTKKAWGGRFREPTDERLEAFGASIDVDREMAEQDIRASMVHARMLARVGILTPEEADAICETLGTIAEEIRTGRLQLNPAYEDIHMNVEAALVERLGDLGRKLHTARSRNDQVVTDLRLWVRDAIAELIDNLREVQKSWVWLAARYCDVVIPAYTHLQPAQPVLFPHYCLAYVEKFERDVERLLDCRKRVNRCPLGAGALAGTSLPIDREFVARELGFDAVLENSLDAVSARDFCIEYLACLTTIMLHLSHWAEEWITWNSVTWGFIKLPDRYCTGSSMMPQKKNPDVLELTRGRTGRVVGALQTLTTLLKGLPLTYNRDLQEDKPPVFAATHTVNACLEMAAPIIRDAELSTDRIAAEVEKGFLDATTLMEYLIARGVPMRTAHELVGQLVARCEEKGKTLRSLTLEEFKQLHEAIGPDVYDVLGPENAVRAFRSRGSTAPDEVKRRLEHWTERLGLKEEIKEVRR